MKFPLGSMTIGDIFDRSLKILFSRLGVIYAITLIALSPFEIFLLAAPFIQPSAANLGLLLAFLLLGLLFFIVLAQIGNAATLHVVAQEYIGRPVTLGDALGFASKRLSALFGTTLLAGLIVMVGFILFVVPGIIFWLNYSLAAQVVVVEGLSGNTALSRSTTLVSGFRGRIFGVMLLIGLINFGILIAVGQLETVLPSLSMVRDASGAISTQYNLTNYYINKVLSQLIGILLGAYSSVCLTLVYFDLRSRKEGYDLELSAQADSSATASV